MKLSLAPIQYYWPKQQVLDFYKNAMDWPIDIVYLGETVCSKRKQMRTEDWLILAEQLNEVGKEVVLSTLSLSEADSDLKTLRRICANNKYMVEANDMGAIGLLEGQTFCTGPSINIYNNHSLDVLVKLGLKRWVLPVELSYKTLQEIQQNKPLEVETEIFAFGRLPLAYSARCFTARAHNLQKDDCQYRCLDYPNGLLLNTQEDQDFLTLNGIQTQSAQTYNLAANIEQLRETDIDILRISPQENHMDRIIDIFDKCRKQEITGVEAIDQLSTIFLSGLCNGYWHQAAGIHQIIEKADFHT